MADKSVKKTRFCWCFILGLVSLVPILAFLLFVTIGHHNASNIATNKIQNAEENICGNGSLMDAQNATIYFKHNPSTDRLPDLAGLSYHSIELIHKRFHTMIVDCPTTSDNRTFQLFLENMTKYNKYCKPLKVWFRLNALDDALDYHAPCSDLATKGNVIFPGTFLGLLGSTDALFGFAESAEPRFNRFTELWHNYSQKIDNVTAQGLKFGIILNPVHCFVLTSQIPDAIISKIGKLFYMPHPSAKIIVRGDNIPVYQIPMIYNECNQFLAGKLVVSKTPKYVIGENGVLPGIPVRPFCVNFE